MSESGERRPASAAAQTDQEGNNAEGQRRRTPMVEIRIGGHLDRCWSDWFGGFAITYPAAGETLLSGRVADQAALQGLLAKIWALGLSLLSVQQKEARSDDDE